MSEPQVPPQHDLDPIIDRATNATPKDSRYTRLRVQRAVLILVSLAALAVAIVALVQEKNAAAERATLRQSQTRLAQAQASSNGRAATDIADSVLSTCRANGKAAAVLRAKKLCSTAADTKITVARGARGAPGQPGPAGSAGSNGTNGSPGAVGSPGARGAVGANGQDGSDGSPGAAGAAGPKGDKGDTGTQGARGPPGAPGANGRDAYPFVFTFTVPGALGDTTYTCTVTGPTDDGSCTSS